MNQQLQKQSSRDADQDGPSNRRTAKQAQFVEPTDDVRAKSQSIPAFNPALALPKETKKPNPGPSSHLSADKKEKLDNPDNHSIEDARLEQHAVEKEDPEAARRFQKYLQSTGISLAFQLIFAEVLQKKIAKDRVLGYTAQRLKQIGADLQELKDHRA